MNRERVESAEGYLTQLRSVDLGISPSALDLLSRVMDQDVTRPPTPAQIERAQAWIHGEQKRRLETALCRLVGTLGGRALAFLAAKAVERYDGHEGYVTIEVGFLGKEGASTTPRTKIRTMVPNAPQWLTSPFEHTSFRAGADFTEDRRILPIALARVLRRTGLDELPQVIWQVPTGGVHLIGARGYTAPELEGTEIIIALGDDSRLNLAPEVRAFLGKYRDKVDRYQPKPSFLGPLSATLAKESPHVFRMFGDVAYWERANPLVDFRLFFYTVVRRLQGVGAG